MSYWVYPSNDRSVTHAQKARALRDEFELATGVRPSYPRSRAALGELRETLDHRYTATFQDVRTAADRRQAKKAFADEFARFGNLPIDDFDLDPPTSTGEPPEDATLMQWAKRGHRREGAAHVFSSWRYEAPDPYDLGDVDVDNIRARSWRIVYDYTLTEARVAQILARIGGDYLVKVKFIAGGDDEEVRIEDGFTPLGRAQP